MLDFEEDYLISLYMKYRERFDKLDQTSEETGLSQEYARGGLTLHRGYYCPSPVKDIVVGGCDRGRLVRKPKSNLPVDYVYLKAGDKLKIIDKYVYECDNISHLHLREFIIDNKTDVVAPIYRMDSDSHDLSFLSLCRYDVAGKIIKYLTFLPGFSFIHGKVIFDKKSCYFTGEQYSYNEQNGLLETVIRGTKMGVNSSYDSYCFYHDETGWLVSYRNI